MLVELLITFSDGHRTAKIMTTKQVFFKPFDLAHAQAGAPIGKASGGTARFVAYAEEADPSCCVVVIEDRFNLIGTRRKSGRVNEAGAIDNPNDLVMLPLGLIDGKPVFVGDEFLGHADTPCVAGPLLSSDFSGCRWPAPARMYPVTAVPHSALFDVYAKALRELGYKNISAESTGLTAVANAALRHAIGIGQVVAKDEYDRMTTQYTQVQGEAFELSKRGTERDLAVAQAVKTYFIYNLGTGSIARFFEGMNLRAIIAGVAK